MKWFSKSACNVIFFLLMIVFLTILISLFKPLTIEGAGEGLTVPSREKIVTQSPVKVTTMAPLSLNPK
jgi:hypothetical protein